LIPGVDGSTKTLYHWKIIRKTQKTSISYLNFTLSLPGGDLPLWPPSVTITPQALNNSSTFKMSLRKILFLSWKSHFY